jgi:hypothetical protein
MISRFSFNDDATGGTPSGFRDFPLVEPPPDDYRGTRDGVAIAYCHTCRCEHGFCERCDSRSCRHVFTLIMGGLT